MKVLNSLSRDDTEHGVYYYLASAVDAELAKKDAEIERLKGNADAAIAFCPTCCQGVTASPDMTRDEVIFHSGRTARSLECAAKDAEIERAWKAAWEARDKCSALTEERDEWKTSWEKGGDFIDKLTAELVREKGLRYEQDEVATKITAERDALAVDLANSQDYAKSEYLLREKAEDERDALAKDAARYKALRDSGYLPPDQFEAQVDAALEATK